MSLHIDRIWAVSYQLSIQEKKIAERPLPLPPECLKIISTYAISLTSPFFPSLVNTNWRRWTFEYLNGLRSKKFALLHCPKTIRALQKLHIQNSLHLLQYIQKDPRVGEAIFIKWASKFNLTCKDEADYIYVFDELLPQLNLIFKSQEANICKEIVQVMTNCILLANNLLICSRAKEEIFMADQKKELRKCAGRIIMFFTKQSNPYTWGTVFKKPGRYDRLLNSIINADYNFSERRTDTDTKSGCTLRLAARQNAVEVLKFLFSRGYCLSGDYLTDLIVHYFKKTPDDLSAFMLVLSQNGVVINEEDLKYLFVRFATNEPVLKLVLDKQSISLGAIEYAKGILDEKIFKKLIRFIQHHPRHRMALDWSRLVGV